jgi:hypothetical protein
MKKILCAGLLIFAVSGFAKGQTDSQLLKCKGYGPEIDYTYYFDSKTLIIDSLNTREIFNKVEWIFDGLGSMGAKLFKLQGQGNHIFLELALDFRGSDGMNDEIDYPYSAISETNFSIGCYKIEKK